MEDIRIKTRNGMVYLEDIGKQTPKSIESEFNTENENVDKIRERLAMLIAANPKDLMTKSDENEYGTVTSFIKTKIDEIMCDSQATYSRLERLSILENILYEWEDTCSIPESNYELPVVNFDDNEQIRAFVYPNRTFSNEVQSANEVSFYNKPHKSNSFNELYADGIKNIKTNEIISKTIHDNVIAYIDGDLFVKYTGKFAFKDKNEAYYEIKKQMNLSFLTRTCKHYLESEQENAKKFYEDVKENIGNEEDKRFVDECLEKIKANEMFCMSKEGSKFNDIITKAFDNYLEKHVKIVQIGKLS